MNHIRQTIEHLKNNFALLKKRFREEPTRVALKHTLIDIWTNGKKPLLYIALGLIVLFILTPIITYLYFIRDFSSKENIMNRKNAGILLVDRNDKPYFTFYEARSKKTVPLSQIPQFAQQAIIAAEDKGFYTHPGFSFQGIGRAFLVNIQQERFAQGGSTISQQLVKTTLLSQNKNLLRKYQEFVLALELERRFSKNDILEMYLNTVYFGEGAFGIEDATRTYFGKGAKDLTLAESALLSGILPAPSAYSPLSGDLDKAFAKQHLVLNAMREQGYISKTQGELAKKENIAFHPQQSGLNQAAPHFAIMVKGELIKKYGEQTVARSGYRIKTTIDLDKQEYAQTVVKNQVRALAGNKVTNAAAVVIHPNTGEILALVGSHEWEDEKNGKFNMVLAPRQPGSSMKPIVYAKAFDERLITPITRLEDKAISFPDGYKPKNYDGKFRGPVTVRYALANSLNIPSVLVMELVGVKHTIQFAERLGITTLKDPSRFGLSLVLGAAEIPLIELTRAYGVFAAEGNLAQTVSIMEIRDRKNNSIYTSHPQKKNVLNSGVAYLISSILSDNKTRADTFGAALTISRPAAVKTGTTEDYRDALTVGYTPNLVIGVWVGNNDRAPMDSIAGSLGAAPIWRLLMHRFLAGTPILNFTKPSEVKKYDICFDLKDGQTATSAAYPEYFLSGTAPKNSCDKLTPSPSPKIDPTNTPPPQSTSTPAPTTDEITPTETQAISSPTPTPLLPSLLDTPTPTPTP